MITSVSCCGAGATLGAGGCLQLMVLAKPGREHEGLHEPHASRLWP